MEVTFTFNGESRSWLQVLPSEARFMSPLMNRETFNIPTRHGAIPSQMTLLPRTLSIPVGIFHEDFIDLQAKKEDLASWLIPQGEGDLIFSDEPFRIYRATLSIPLGQIVETATYTTGVLTFTCYDPFKYGLTELEHEIHQGNVTIHNGGSAPTHCVIQFIMPSAINEVMVRHVQSGKEMRLVRQFTLGDHVTIDTSRRLILINNVPAMASLDLHSRWFELSTGENTFQISANTMGTIRFTQRWF